MASQLQKNSVASHITVTDGLHVFALNNITSADGNFSINFTFPKAGPCQIIARFDSDGANTLASFNTYIPPQATSSATPSTEFTSISDVFTQNLLPLNLIIAGAAVGVTYSVMRMRKMNKR